MKKYPFYEQKDFLELINFMKSQSMATLITWQESEVHCGVHNMVYENNRLWLHTNKTDTQCTDMLNQNVVKIIFFEHLTDIPSYFVHPTNASFATSYYRYLEIEGRAVIHTDPLRFKTQLQLFLDQFQPEGGYAPLDENEETYLEAANRISVIEILIEKIDSKWKLAQNHPKEKRLNFVAQLKQRNQGKDMHAAKEIEKWIAAHP